MIVPTRVEDLLLWAEAHNPIWTGAGAQIGLSPLQTTQFKAAYTAAAADYLSYKSARDALDAAHTTSDDSVRVLRRTAADMIRFIKAFAETQTKPAVVYAAAQIPPPGQPGPAGPPGTPFDFRAVLNPDGSISFRWKCNNPAGTSGTIYNIRRRLSTESSPTFIGAVGARRFDDSTIPVGTASAQYIVTAQRGTETGPASSPFTVQFGQGGGGLSITGQFSGEGGQGKLAA